MKRLLDTNICIYVIKKKPEKVLKRFNAFVPGDIGISSITLAELRFGVEKSSERARNQDALEGFLLAMEIAPFDDEAAHQYGVIRAGLEKKGKPIGSMDMQIAAHALALAVPLVTNDVGEFGRVPGLALENWA